MSCMRSIRAHFEMQNANSVVTTRDVLGYGFRNSVDKALSRLVKIGFIKRLARGVFIKKHGAIPGIFEIARIKAAAFGKEVVTHGQENAVELALLTPEKESQSAFYVKGRSSSFACVHGRIYLHGRVSKKMFGEETVIGRVVRAICFVGAKMQDGHLLKVLSQVEEKEYHHLLNAARWMPSWLADDVRECLIGVRDSTNYTAKAS